MLFIIILIILMKTKVKILIKNIYDDTRLDVNIGLIKIEFNYNNFVSNLSKVTHNKDLKYYLEYMKRYKYVKDIYSNINLNINKINIIKKNNIDKTSNIYLNTTYYVLYNIAKNHLIENIKSYNDISFSIIPSNTDDIDFDIDLDFNLLLFINAILVNIKNILKMKKDMV